MNIEEAYRIDIESAKDMIYEQTEEIERLNNRIAELEKGVSRKEEQITDLDDENFDLESVIDKAIEYIEKERKTYENDEYCFDNMLEDVTPLLDILKGVDKE